MTIKLQFPPSVNRLWKVAKGKVYRSADYEAWRAPAAWEARVQAGPKKITGQFKLTAHFVRPDNRHRDLDNLLKALLDALQHGGVIANDKNCIEISAKWVEEGPPCEVMLEEVNDGQEK